MEIDFSKWAGVNIDLRYSNSDVRKEVKIPKSLNDSVIEHYHAGPEYEVCRGRIAKFFKVESSQVGIAVGRIGEKDRVLVQIFPKE